MAQEQDLSNIQKELDIARSIQVSVLPSEFPASASFRVNARYLPMTSVAGDFYDFLLANDKQAGILIADVSGHGVPAALIASMVKLAAPAQIANVSDPSNLLNGMNATLLGNTQRQFVTAAYVYLDAEIGEFKYSAAAHPAMLLLRNNEVIKISENGLMLAASSFAAYTSVYRRIIELGKTSYPEVSLLTQVHGVGPLVALTYILTLEDPHRFAKSRDAGCYIGLQPARRNSGSCQPQLHITKEGDPCSLRAPIIFSDHLEWIVI